MDTLNPSPQLSLFEGRTLRDAGMAQVTRSQKAQAWLAEARNVAERIAALRGSVTSDDVLVTFDLWPGLHWNIIGSLFRDARFEPCGYTQSRRASRHAAVIRVWGLKDAS